MLANDSSGLRVMSGSTTSPRSSKHRYIAINEVLSHKAASESTDHDWLALLRIVHNPKPVLGPGNRDIETFKLNNWEVNRLTPCKRTLSPTSWIRGAYFESSSLF